MESSCTKDWTPVPYTGRQILNQWTTREVHKWLLNRDSEPCGGGGADVPCICVVVAACLWAPPGGGVWLPVVDPGTLHSAQHTAQHTLGAPSKYRLASGGHIYGKAVCKLIGVRQSCPQHPATSFRAAQSQLQVRISDSWTAPPPTGQLSPASLEWGSGGSGFFKFPGGPHGLPRLVMANLEHPSWHFCPGLLLPVSEPPTLNWAPRSIEEQIFGGQWRVLDCIVAVSSSGGHVNQVVQKVCLEFML